jgi:hypothetical protein
MEQITNARISALIELSLEDMACVAGGQLPKGTWEASLPKGTWEASLPKGTWESSLPKGTWES